MKFVCAKCGHTEDVATRKSKCECGGLWKLDYVPPPYSVDLIDNKVWGLFRYHNFMPLRGEAWQQVTLGEGMTPIITLLFQICRRQNWNNGLITLEDAEKWLSGC